jgi:thioredoxin 1
MASDPVTGSESADETASVAVTDETELRRLREAGDPVVLEFHADWCAACSLVEPALEQLAAERPITVARIDVEREPLAPVIERYGVSRLPSVVLLIDGERTGVRTGIHNKATLRSFLDSHLE